MIKQFLLRIETFSPQKIAAYLISLALLKSLLLILILGISYGADGGFYMQYIEGVKNPAARGVMWYIHGTTPIYPFFAHGLYLAGFKTGYLIVLVQVLLGASVAGAMYLALRPLHERGALLAGLLIAIDPQTGHLYQLVASEALYIGLNGLGMAVFFWLIQQKDNHYLAVVGIGVLLGVGALVRPAGTFLIVPYIFFLLLITRSLKKSALLAAGYLAVYLTLCFFNLWRFDFFAPNSTGGLYLGTRLFAIGELYDRDNGTASEKLYDLAEDCDIYLSGQADTELTMIQNLRLCLQDTHEMSFPQIADLFGQAYNEAVQDKPGIYVKTLIKQLGVYAWRTSDAFDRAWVNDVRVDCSQPPPETWSGQVLFCPAIPRPFAFLGSLTMLFILGFSLLTRILNFMLAAVVFRQSSPLIRWLFLFCLGFYSYHAVVTAAAATILSRYITVANLYMLVTLAFAITLIYETTMRKPETQELNS